MGHWKAGVPFFLLMNLTITVPDSESLHLDISFTDSLITGINYCLSGQAHSVASADADSNEFAAQIRHQFAQYFRSSHDFSLPCQFSQGTEFQQKVWQALLRIPAGEVLSYGALAKRLDSSARAVGNACRSNPFPIVVPCHRVVSASGIGGYAGDTLTRKKGEINYLHIKQWLLTHEQAKFQ